MKKALVLASSRGIGRGIADSLSELDLNVIRISTNELDTSNIDSVDKFIEKQKKTDILVLNTGGPPAQEFSEITKDDCDKYHNQLFYSFFRILQKIEIIDNGFIFLITSFNVKEPNPKLLLSNAYRVAFISVLKCLSKDLAKRGITTIGIAPGPIKTDRLNSLVADIAQFESQLPLGRAGETKEIGSFVKSVVENNIKYLNGVTINFDGGLSNNLF